MSIEELKCQNEILKDALCMEQDRLSHARHHIQNAQKRIKRLEELGKELRECANQIGYTSSDEIKWIKRAGLAVKAWDKEANP